MNETMRQARLALRQSLRKFPEKDLIVITRTTAEGFLKEIEEVESGYAQLQSVVVAYHQAAEKFVKKVEGGQARSVETYQELKAALESERASDRKASEQ